MPTQNLTGILDPVQATHDLHTNLADFLLIAAQQEPDRVAIETEMVCCTYSQLAHMVVSVQLVLRRALDRCEEVTSARNAAKDMNVDPVPFHRRRPDEHLVCIVLERGPECLAAVHATMLEGCAYNTFDVAEPREKLRTWVEIAQHPVMITSQQVMNRLGMMERGWEIGGVYPRFVINVYEALRKGEERTDALPAPAQRPADLDRLCYVVFTSGSTGKPKAVMIQHRSACNLVRVWSDFVGVGPGDRLAQMASVAFDNHVPEVYGAMYKKCTSVVVPDLMKRSGPDMVSWLASKHVTVMVTVPSHLRSMLGPGTDVSTAALPHLRVLDIGGEALGKDVLDAWAPGRCMFNIYGPTEITVVCAGVRVRPGDEITIGHDLPTYHNHVLDPEMLRECPTGVRGVLYTGGVGTARGYLDDEEKTTGKFVQVPDFGRMYCSGDVVSKDEQGRFHYHGRADWQVKVRGIRIELEALEEAVGNIPAVKHCEARVVAGGAKLALIASGTVVSEAEIKTVAAKLGKGYQLNIVKLVEQSAWKFNTSGKLVRNHVPLESGTQEEAKQTDSWESFAQEGASELELEIAKCVAQLVSATAWNKESHFIEELGVDSAGFGKLVTLMRRQSSLQLVDLPMLFSNPAVAALATAVERRRRAQADDDSDSEIVRKASTDDSSLYSLFSEIMTEPECSRAHALCVQTQTDTLTYAQLVRRAGVLQGLLKKALRACASCPTGIARVVLLLLDHGADLLTAIVATVLERHAFCIADTKWTRAKLLDVIRAVQPCAIFMGADQRSDLVQQDLHSIVRMACPILRINSPAIFAGGARKVMRRPRVQPPFCCVTVSQDDSGYVKGLTWSDQAVFWAIKSWQNHMNLGPGDRSAQLVPLSEPEGIVAFWATFAAGASMLLPPAGSRPGQGLRSWLHHQRASILVARPPLLRILGALGASSQANLRLVWAVGRECAGDLAKNWCRHGRRFTYAYCNPEVAAASFFDASPDMHVVPGEKLPLGTTFEGCQCNVLDHDFEPTLAHAVGDLYISTPGSASGVLDVSDSAFPFVQVGEQAVNTGLKARCVEDGRITLVTAAEARQTPMSRGSRRGHKRVQRDLEVGAICSTHTCSSASMTPRTLISRAASKSIRSFGGYLIQNADKDALDNPYGEDAALTLCLLVQTGIILAQPLFGAVSLVLMSRFLGPYSMHADFYLAIIIITAAFLAQQVFQVMFAILLKWLLIGRYREGDYSIYGTYFLKHWIVDRFSSGSVFGGGSSQAGWNFSVGTNFMKVLSLKAMGCDVSLSSMVTTRVVGFDCVSIGPLASVHGPHHLTAVQYYGKRMVIGRVTVGQGATVCHGASLGLYTIVGAGAFVEPLTSIVYGTVAEGRWTGVPGRQVGPARGLPWYGKQGDSSENFSGAEAESETSARRLALAGCCLGLLQPLLLPLQMAALFASLALAQWVVAKFDDPLWYTHESKDALPPLIMDNLGFLPLITVGQSLLSILVSLLMPVFVCRLLPKVRPPMDVPIYHWRGMLAGMKLFLATKASQTLGDASIQAWYLRLLGARVGRGSSMSEQTLLPDTLEMGENCFFASGNTLTGVEVDQGRLRVVCKTKIGDGCFLGNENHVAEGLRPETFVGLRTWVPSMPEGGGSLFGNPAMKFGRPAPAEGAMEGSICQKAWHHFSTSVIDVFLWPLLYALSTGVAFIIGRSLFPKYSSDMWPLEFIAEVFIFTLVRVLAWLLVSIGFCNCIYNDRMPLSAPYYSTVITRWFSANKIRRTFKRPVQTAGSFWDASVLRLMGVHVGRRFFSPNQDVMIDPPFGRLGDDVTVTYDGQVRQHSFEDDVLKWGPYHVGNNTNIAQASMVAMSEIRDGVNLLRGSVTWKGQVLEAGTYEGAPAAPVDELFEACRAGGE